MVGRVLLLQPVERPVPGRALLHFEKWDDDNGNFSYCSWAATPIVHGHTNIDNPTLVGWPNSSYTTYRYKNIVDDVSAGRIGAVKNGQLFVKEGSLDATWVPEHDNVTALSLSGNRIGVVRTDGTAVVKEGSLDATWVPEHDTVSVIALA